MPRLRFSRFVFALTLIAILSTPSAWAEPRATAGQPVWLSQSGALSQLWSLLASLWGEEGCGINPNGACATEARSSFAEEGCIIDPNGGCGRDQASFTDAGCGIDPHGGGCSH